MNYQQLVLFSLGGGYFILTHPVYLIIVLLQTKTVFHDGCWMVVAIAEN